MFHLTDFFVRSHSVKIAQRASTSLAMDRRTAATQIASAAAVLSGLPSLALADGARSAATEERARGIYGQRIAALESAVNAGDFGAVAAEKNAFILYNSGGISDKAKKAAAVKDTNAIFAAIRAKDAGALKSAYSTYKSTNGIKAIKADVSTGQGYSSDYDYKTRTAAG
jgi:hypothetical protein